MLPSALNAETVPDKAASTSEIAGPMLPVVSTTNSTSAWAVVGDPALISPTLLMEVEPPTVIVSVKLLGESESAKA
jgi:hypothetical protein